MVGFLELNEPTVVILLAKNGKRSFVGVYKFVWEMSWPVGYRKVVSYSMWRGQVACGVR